MTAILEYSRAFGLWSRRGQTMTEYILIMTLVVVAVIAAYEGFGTTISTYISGAANLF